MTVQLVIVAVFVNCHVFSELSFRFDEYIQHFQGFTSGVFTYFLSLVCNIIVWHRKNYTYVQMQDFDFQY